MTDQKLLPHGAPTLTVDNDGKIKLDGCDLFTGSESELLEALDELVRSDVAELVVTPNVDQVIDLGMLPAFRSAFHSAALRLMDGAPLVVLARVLGARNVARQTGADLLPLVVKASEATRWRIAIVGGGTHVLRAAVARLRENYPTAFVKGVAFPFIDDVASVSSEEVLKALEEINPDIVFLCLGAPKQETWFAHWERRLPPAVFVGAGAAVDFAAGSKSRAPRLVQSIGAEWLWRVAQEPVRLGRRYFLKGPKFIAICMRSIYKSRELA
jgi:N-acetylglucosaminyldiphosphoundecaprenol N-acetyl-beta-D-mannosaminyltransferase